MELRVTRAVTKGTKRTSNAAFGVEAKNDDDKCAICLDDLHSRDITTLFCGHKFHSTCMMTNVMTNNTKCPLCRQKCISEKAEEVSSDSDEEQSEMMILLVADRIQNKLGRTAVLNMLSHFQIPRNYDRLAFRSLCEIAAEQLTHETDDEEEEN